MKILLIAVIVLVALLMGGCATSPLVVEGGSTIGDWTVYYDETHQVYIFLYQDGYQAGISVIDARNIANPDEPMRLIDVTDRFMGDD